MLPRFTERGSCYKQQRATEADVRKTYIQEVTLKELSKLGRGATVLDFGCGRGTTAAALRQRGYAAYGVEIVEDYILNGCDILPESDSLGRVLSLLGSSGRSEFPDAVFDAVVSDQVLEHVEDLDVVLSEISRVLKPGGVTVHTFPAAHTIVEPHVKVPVVHWLPKGELRDAGVRAAVGLGLSVPHFSEFRPAQRARIYSRFLDTDTCYRPIRTIRAAFAKHGLNARVANRDKLIARGGLVAKLAQVPVIGDVGTALYGTFVSVSIVATKAS
jgi:SAM-dependent methyltransferase